MNVEDIRKKVAGMADPEKARILRGFFKTKPGQYGEGDIFLGITVPALRALARECCATTIAQARRLLRSSIHEERLLALLLLIDLYRRGDARVRKKIFVLYLDNTRFINNWDLVDLSAPNIVGGYLFDKSRKPLYRLARSRDLWERRIAIVATFYWIRREDYEDTLRIGAVLLADEHDLIRKAVGWMLREIGKRDLAAEERFLRLYYKKMPRTMLRYAIERFPEQRRKRYLLGTL